MSDPYAENEIQPDDLPLLAEITEEDAHAMAMPYADEQSDDGIEIEELEIDEFEIDDDEEEWNDDDGMSDAEADADTLRMAGMGTDEDYGYDGGDF